MRTEPAPTKGKPTRSADPRAAGEKWMRKWKGKPVPGEGGTEIAKMDAGDFAFLLREMEHR